MIKPSIFLCAMSILPCLGLAQEPTIHISAPQLQGSRPLEKQTEAAVVRDYLKGWRSLSKALNSNDINALNADFVGVALDRLDETIQGQIRDGIHTTYTDQSHELQICFYSPEGLSIQLIDTVQYLQKISLGNKEIAAVTVKQPYIVIMTPSDVRWLIRVFQAQHE